MAKLKAFVRFNGSGTIVPSSIILAKSKPRVGKWVEIDAYECCNYIPTTTTTTTLDPLCRQFMLENTGRAFWNITLCDDTIYAGGVDQPSTWRTFPCGKSVNSFTGEYQDLGQCYPCKQWTLTADSYPFTYGYNDCNGNSQSIEINEPTTICAQGINGISPNVSYIGPCPT
jgi:hypothetical protein